MRQICLLRMLPAKQITGIDYAAQITEASIFLRAVIRSCLLLHDNR